MTYAPAARNMGTRIAYRAPSRPRTRRSLYIARKKRIFAKKVKKVVDNRIAEHTNTPSYILLQSNASNVGQLKNNLFTQVNFLNPSYEAKTTVAGASIKAGTPIIWPTIGDSVNGFENGYFVKGITFTILAVNGFDAAHDGIRLHLMRIQGNVSSAFDLDNRLRDRATFYAGELDIPAAPGGGLSDYTLPGSGRLEKAYKKLKTIVLQTPRNNNTHERSRRWSRRFYMKLNKKVTRVSGSMVETFPSYPPTMANEDSPLGKITTLPDVLVNRLGKLVWLFEVTNTQLNQDLNLSAVAPPDNAAHQNLKIEVHARVHFSSL